MSDRNEILSCTKCVLFRRHDIYEYLGVCANKNELVILTPNTKVCEGFKKYTFEELEKILAESGWLHCVSCNKALSSIEELSKHAMDIVVPELHIDDVASEETPAAD